MLKWLLKSLLQRLLILILLVIASFILPVASFWLVRDPLGGQLFFWLSPWTCAVWAVLVSVLIGSRFWLGKEYVLAWRAARGGYVMSSLKSTALMFLALLASYAFEFAVILLLPGLQLRCACCRLPPTHQRESPLC
jgi:membrane-associated protease RseP (regulator of RpoE activity)